MTYGPAGQCIQTVRALAGVVHVAWLLGASGQV